MSLKTLKRAYPYPTMKPGVPTDDHGWFAWANKKMFGPMVKDAKVIVEIGSWLGLSTRFWLEKAPKAHLICIDTWEGSSEHALFDECKDRLPTLFDTFIENQWQWRKRITPIREKSCDGLMKLVDHEVKPDFIYVDGSHEELDVLVDLHIANRYLPDATIIGDDWNYIHKVPGQKYKTVQVAVNKFCDVTGHEVIANNWAWVIKKKIPQESLGI